MLYQIDKNLHPMIQKYGCYFLCKLEVIEEVLGIQFNCMSINNIYYKFIDNRYIDEECLVIDKLGIMSYFGIKCNYKKVGIDYNEKNNDYVITCYERTYFNNKLSNYITYTHFVRTKNKEIIFDPTPNSNAVKYGIIIDKRIYTII